MRRDAADTPAAQAENGDVSPGESAVAAVDEPQPSQAAGAEPSRRPRLFGFLVKRVPGEVPAAPRAPAPQAANIQPENPPEPAAVAAPETALADLGVVRTPPPDAGAEPSRRPRPFGFLFKRVPGEVAGPPDSQTDTASDTASDSAPEAAQPAAPVPQRRRGIFALRERTPAPSDPMQVLGPGVILPFGQVATVCGLPRKDLGTEVARSHGSGKYRLYDTAPSSTQPRAQFVTGFDDRCARQFTASLALFGSVEVHEATRYNPLNTNPYSDTDEAYERVKRRVCGVQRGASCPVGRIDRLSRDTAFVSVYRNFGDTGAWLELFLHRGELLAHETRLR